MTDLDRILAEIEEEFRASETYHEGEENVFRLIAALKLAREQRDMAIGAMTQYSWGEANKARLDQDAELAKVLSDE